MPIVGLTGEAKWTRLGVLRKGAQKPNERQPGADLNEKLRFQGLDVEIEEDWKATFGSLEIEQLMVRLPYATVDEVWSAWREEWLAGGLKRRCDGATVCVSQTSDGGYDLSPRPCQAPQCGCDDVGRLALVVPEFQRLGTVTLLTTSVHDIMNLDGCIRALAITVGNLSQVPLVLKRVPRPVSMPETRKENGTYVRTGRRVRTTKWLLHLEPAPEWVRGILEGGSSVAALAGSEALALPAPNGDGETTDLVALPAPRDDTVDPATGEILAGDAAAVQNGFRARIEACTTLDELRAVWPDITAIEEAAYKANVIALWRTQAVVIIRAFITRADGPGLRALGEKLDALPDGTPGKAEAVAELEARVWADRAPATVEQPAMLPMAAEVVG